jgi:hypothetical protein
MADSAIGSWLSAPIRPSLRTLVKKKRVDWPWAVVVATNPTQSAIHNRDRRAK